MPIPNPNSKELEDEFISGCMKDKFMKKEFPDTQQRVAVCFSQGKKHSKQEKYLNKKDK